MYGSRRYWASLRIPNVCKQLWTVRTHVSLEMTSNTDNGNYSDVAMERENLIDLFLFSGDKEDAKGYEVETMTVTSDNHLRDQKKRTAVKSTRHLTRVWQQCETVGKEEELCSQ